MQTGAYGHLKGLSPIPLFSFLHSSFPSFPLSPPISLKKAGGVEKGWKVDSKGKNVHILGIKIGNRTQKRWYSNWKREQSKCVCLCFLVCDSCLTPRGDNSWDSIPNTCSEHTVYSSLHFSLNISISLHPLAHLLLHLLFPFI